MPSFQAVRKGGKVVTIPLAPRTARAVDLAVGERCDGPIFWGADGDRLDRHAASRIVRRIARRAGITKRVGPTCGMPSSSPRSTPAWPYAMSKKQQGTPIRARPCATTALASRSTDTPPTSSPPSSPGPPGNRNHTLASGACNIAPERAICRA